MADNAFRHLDAMLEHRVRLAICALLSRTEQITFSRFKEVLEQTDGALGAQLRKLEDAGYIALRRTFDKRRPATWYRLTSKGRKALRAHLDALQRLIEPQP